MDSDERQICEYLKSWPQLFVSAREIARRAAGKRRFREDAQWAYPVINRLIEQGLIETDGLGHYRSPYREKKPEKQQKWIAPHLRHILQNSGKDFTHVLESPDERSDSGHTA